MYCAFCLYYVTCLMETYFNIRYELDKPTVLEAIDRQVRFGRAGYVCVADGVILDIVNRDPGYRKVEVGGSRFPGRQALCDSQFHGLGADRGCPRRQLCGLLRQVEPGERN